MKTFDQHCEYRRTTNGVVLAPVQHGRWLVLFCDEINLPDMDKYGAFFSLVLLYAYLSSNRNTTRNLVPATTVRAQRLLPHVRSRVGDTGAHSNRRRLQPANRSWSQAHVAPLPTTCTRRLRRLSGEDFVSTDLRHFQSRHVTTGERMM